MANFSFRLSDRDGELISIQAYRKRALRYLPKMVATYIEGVAEDGETFARNRRAFDRLALRARVPNGIGRPDLATKIGGELLKLPLMLAPTGLAGLVRPDGEVALVRAAETCGTRAILSMATSTPPETVALATRNAHWFQLYPVGDPHWVGEVIDRIAAAGFGSLVVTVDSAVVGKRDAERAAGLTFPIRLNLARCFDLLAHPAWLARHARYRRGLPVMYPRPDALQNFKRMMQIDLSWDDLRRLRDRWPRRFYVKGLLHPDDAVTAIRDIGADGVILSNHGGRQLGSTISPMTTLPMVAERLRGEGEILLDGGIRRGSDVVKALSLGADAVMIGRPHLYGLAVGGEDGVKRIIDIFREEIEISMQLIGCPSVDKLQTGAFVVDDSHPVLSALHHPS